MKYINGFFLILFCSLQCMAQYPDNFEVLDHGQRWSQLGANLLMNDSLLYVSHNGQWPMTSIKFIHPDNRIEKVFETGFSGKSKIVRNQDGSIDLFIYDLIDYDVFIPGFYTIRISDGQYSIEEYIDESFSNYDYLAYDVIRDIDSSFWLIRETDLAKISNGTIESIYELDQDYFKYSLHKNPAGKAFIYDANTVFQIGQNKLEPRLSFPDKIIDIIAQEDLNLILFNDRLIAYDSNFDSLQRSWNLPSEVKSMEYIQTLNDTLYYLSSQDEYFELYRSDQNGSFSLIISGNNQFESIKGFNVFNDSSFLLKGHFSVDNIFSNIFLRKISSHSTENYKRLDLELTEFKLHRTGKDSSFIHVISEGDSVFSYNYNYDYSLEFRNNSDTPVFTTNIFSRSFYGFFGPFDAYFRLDFDDTLSPGESFYKSGSFDVPLSSNTLDDLKLISPGVNNRFNSSSMSAIIADFSSALVETGFIKYDVLLYPNPSSDFIKPVTKLPYSRVFIYDSSGSLVFASNFTSDKIDVSIFESGLYYVLFIDDKGKKLANGSFVKQ